MDNLRKHILDGNFEVSEEGLLVPKSRVLFGGIFSGEIIRAGKVIDKFEDHNLVVNEGLNHILSAIFNAVTPLTSWYLGVYEGNYTPVASVTAATLPAAATECTAYAAATRPQFIASTVASQNTNNTASRASFVFNATKSLYGTFLTSDSAKNGVAGKLMSATRFATVKNVESADELLLSYSYTAQSV